MFTQFQNYLAKAVGTSAVTVITCPAGVQLTLNGVSVSNITASPSTPVTVSVIITRNATDIFVVKDATIPAGGSLTCAGEDQRIVMMAGDLLKVVSSRASSVDVVAGGLINDFNPTAPISGPDFTNGVTAGRVFAYDAGNPKSFIGRPITNQFLIPTPNPTTGIVNFAAQGVANAMRRITSGEFGGYVIQPTDVVYRYDLGQNACHYFGQTQSVPAGTAVTFSFDYLIGPNAVGYPEVNYLANFEGVLSGVATDPTPNITGVWKRASFTSTASSTGNANFLLYPGACGARLAVSGYILYKNPQVEYSPFATTFVQGTRGSTQALLDLTGNNVMTVNNLNYPAANALEFTGSSWIEMPTSAVFDSQTITMESWCRPTVTAQSGFLFEKGQVNTQYSNFFNGDGTFFFRTIGLSPQDLTFASASFITANAWNHIVCTVGGGLKRIYVNGVVRAEVAYSGTMPTGQTNQYIGKYGNAGNNYPFLGQIAVSKVYNRALTADEVLLNFNALRTNFGL